VVRRFEEQKGESRLKLEEIKILAIETSCDETSVAIIKNGKEILTNIISSQIPCHQKFGGVVPEIASRKHVELINPVIQEALDEASLTLADIDAVAVTYGPGLVGALLVGVSTAKALAFAMDVPLIGVNHMEGHIYANFLANDLEFPVLCLVVSGGHTELILIREHGTYELLGKTRDDAAGEAFDKVARSLGLGYPGGPLIDKLAKEGNPEGVVLPRAYLEEGSLDFSFSGLKSAVLNYLNRAQQKGETINQADLAASFQRSVTDVLVNKTIRAAKQVGVKNVILAGGVAANVELRERLSAKAEDNGLALYYPPLVLCTDNAAMIGAAAYYKFIKGDFAPLNLNALPNLKLGEKKYF